MKFIFLAGGCVGFIVVGGASLLAGHAPDRALFDAAVGCLAAAMLFRWFWAVLVKGMRETVVTRSMAPVLPAAEPHAGVAPVAAASANGAPPARKR